MPSAAYSMERSRVYQTSSSARNSHDRQNWSSPSPLNGERAGVRGEIAPAAPITLSPAAPPLLVPALPLATPSKEPNHPAGQYPLSLVPPQARLQIPSHSQPLRRGL